MGRIKYIPMFVSLLTIALLFIAFGPLADLLLVLGISATYARIIAGVLVVLPLLFIVGINSNRRIFTFIMIILGILLVIGFFLWA